ncbi:MAG: pentapeptide repeat-containing protein [Planctomycetes bacterium]|nr:pentapeptide repeat-containing protein [Planctomycetota bacterium]
MTEPGEEAIVVKFCVRGGLLADSDLDRVRVRWKELYGDAEDRGLLAAAVDVGGLDLERVRKTYEDYVNHWYRCPGCGKLLNLEGIKRPIKVRCKGCQQVMDIPVASRRVRVAEVAVPAEGTDATLPDAAPAAPAAPPDLFARLAASNLLSQPEAEWARRQKAALEGRGEPVSEEGILLASRLVGEDALLSFLRGEGAGRAAYFVALFDEVPFRVPVRRRKGRRRQSRSGPKWTYLYRPPPPPPAPIVPAAQIARPAEAGASITAGHAALFEGIEERTPEGAEAAAGVEAPAAAPAAALEIAPAPSVPAAPVAEPSPPPSAPLPPGALEGDTIDLSGLVVAEAVDLSGRKLREVRLRGTVFRSAFDLSRAKVAEKLDAKGARFEMGASFQKADLAGGADFAECLFGPDAQFNETRFGRYATFREAEFGGAARFTRAQFPKGVKFDRTTFRGDLSLNDVRAGHRFQMEKADAQGSSTITGATFEELVSFKDCRFAGAFKSISASFAREARFEGCHFQSEAVFFQSAFDGDLKMLRPRFDGPVDFKEVSVEKSLSIRWAEYGPQGAYVLAGAHLRRLDLRRKDVEGRVRAHRDKKWTEARAEYGFLKKNFRETNEYGDEDWAYRMEKRMARHAIPLAAGRPLSALQRFFDWLALDLACGYGTLPVNVFAASLETSWAPGSGSPLAYVAALESFLGIFIVAVLVVTFSRKVIR